MRYMLVLLIIGMMQGEAAAQDVAKPAVDPVLCQQLIAYQMPQEPGVSAEYVPGVDAEGNPVVEADVAPPVVPAPTAYEFPITVNMAAYLGMDMPEGLMAESRVGSVTVGQSGQVLFNGNPMETNAETTLKSLCGILPPPSLETGAEVPLEPAAEEVEQSN